MIISNSKEQKCVNCDTVYEYVYDNGWKFEVKGYRTRKCVYCKNNIFLPMMKEEVRYSKIQCSTCKMINIDYRLYGSCELVGYDTLVTACAWCNKKIEIDISETSNKWITTGEDQCQQKKVTCQDCKRDFLSVYGVSNGHPTCMIRSERIYTAGRKKKATEEMVEKFLNIDSIYQTYNIVHPYNVYEYCEQSHIDEDVFFDLLSISQIEIFEPIDMKNIDYTLYETEFLKLKLREAAKEEAGGLSLSKLLGGTNAWKRMRQMLLDDQDYTCAICGYRTENTKALHAHEEWEYEDEKCLLKSVTLICSRCHACKHRNEFIAYRVLNEQSELVDGIPRQDLLAIHLMRVNHVSKEVIYAYRKKLLEHLKKVREEEKSTMSEENNEIEYKYIIDDSVVNKKELEGILDKKGKLYKRKK